MAKSSCSRAPLQPERMLSKSHSADECFHRMALIRRAISVRRSCAAAPHGAHRTYCGSSMNASVKRADVLCPRTWNVPARSCVSAASTEAGGGRAKVSEYRHHAKECRGLAKQSRSAEHREMFLNIAATWESLANDRIKTAEGLERIAKLKKPHGRAASPRNTHTDAARA